MKKIISALLFSLVASMISVAPAIAIDPPSGWTYPTPSAPTIISQSDPFCAEPDKRCDGVSIVVNTPEIPDFDSRYMSALYLKVGTTGAMITNGQQGVVITGLAYAKSHTAVISYFTSEGPLWVTHYGNSTSFTTIAMAASSSSTVATLPLTETATIISPTPTPTPAAESAPSRIPFTQPCTGGSDRTPGLPQCLMPEGIGGSVWNLVDNNSGAVLNGAVCSEGVCGRNGEWRQWPADRKLNDRLWPTGYPEGATYIQTPFDYGYWGRYFTNGVYEVNGGGILQPGSRTIIWPVQTPIPGVDTRTVTTETSTSVIAPETSTSISSPQPIPTPIATPTQFSDTSTTVARVESTTVQIPVATTLVDEDANLDEVVAEEEIIDSIEAMVQSNGTTRILVSTGYNLTALTVVATKKGSKRKYTYKITTNADGERKFKSGLNLRGYTVVLLKGSTELDRMYVS
jgi:hypothetical protein